MIGIVAATAAGRRHAEHLAAAWPDARSYPGPLVEALPRAYGECDTVAAFAATGAVVRLVAPLLGGKQTDPGVVCVDEACRFAVPVLGGHAGGANELARRLADVLGCTPAVTTASESTGVTALDTFGADLGFRVADGSQLAAVGAAVLAGERVDYVSDHVWPVPALPDNVVTAPAPEPGVPAVVVTDRAGTAGDGPRVVYRPPSLVVGVGASSGVNVNEVEQLISAALTEAGLALAAVRHLATADIKADEGGIVEAARRRGWPLVTYPAHELAAATVPNPSEIVRAEVGTPSVAEAAALYGDSRDAQGGAELVVAKRKSAMATVAVARLHPRGRLTCIGLGPGERDLSTPRAITQLQRASVVVGLDQYLDQIRDVLRPGTRALSSGLGAEAERARAAVDEARSGHAVALVGSGDAGIYAMASPALEEADATIDVTGVPGVTAALAASSLLGAPLGHDHAYISLSDLHTPREAIERRVLAAAQGDFAVVFYNPKSRARDWQLGAALETLAAHRPPRTPVGIVRNASRGDESATVTSLDRADLSEVDMFTVVFVGSSQTRVVGGRMVTPRGYRWRDQPPTDAQPDQVRKPHSEGEPA